MYEFFFKNHRSFKIALFFIGMVYPKIKLWKWNWYVCSLYWKKLKNATAAKNHSPQIILSVVSLPEISRLHEFFMPHILWHEPHKDIRSRFHILLRSMHWDHIVPRCIWVLVSKIFQNDERLRDKTLMIFAVG